MSVRAPAGMMRHTVTVTRHKIDTGSTAYDTYGQVASGSTAQQTDFVCRAAIEQLSGREAEVARQLYAAATYRVTIDYASTMDSTGAYRRQVKIGDRWLNVGAVINPDFENRQLLLLCGEER